MSIYEKLTCVPSTRKALKTIVQDLYLSGEMCAHLLQVPLDNVEGIEQASGVLEPSQSVYALGDCCANSDTPLPPLAQVTFSFSTLYHTSGVCSIIHQASLDTRQHVGNSQMHS